MEPNFSDDQAVLFSHLSDQYERFDVVIIYRDNEAHPYLIKRIIGLPNETVRISNNEIYINDVLLPQDFIDQNVIKTYCTNQNISDFGVYTDNQNCSFTVPENAYFVLGDNRDGNGIEPSTGYSLDSRYFGPITTENIYGKVVFTFKDYNLIN